MGRIVKNYIHFLNEETINGFTLEQKLDEVFDKCKPYIDLIKSCKKENLLYRGVNYYDIQVKKIDHNWNREPLDTPMEIHEFLNNEFKNKFDWNARNGVFSFFKIAKKNQISGYEGETYMLFPIGDFNYLWNPKIYDLYGDYEMEMEGFYVPEDVIIDEWDEYKTKDSTEKDYNDFYNMRMESYKEDFYLKLENIVNSYINHGLCHARQTNEIIVNCDSYYLINMNYTDQIRKRIWG